MLTPECLGELRSAWLPNMTDSGLERLISLLEKGSPLLIHGCFTRAVPMGCLASHLAWHHPRTAHLTLDAGITWLHGVAHLNPATSLVLREWDHRGTNDLELRTDLLAVLQEERQARHAKQTGRPAAAPSSLKGEEPMLPRILEPEVMDTAVEARDYDAMDHAAVNRVFVTDFLTYQASLGPTRDRDKPFGHILDVGTGTAQIPIELCNRGVFCQMTAIDLAEQMLRVGRENLRRHGLENRVRLERWDAKHMPCAPGTFDTVISNSIVHHIPAPAAVFAEMVRVVRPGGLLFVRDLLRPADDATLGQLVELHAAGANDHQKKMFAESLHAALTVDEVQALVMALGFPADSVRQTTDRHWTWQATKPTS